jgi:hypothetical protein
VLIKGLAFGDVRVFESVAYVPAAAVIILAAMLQMLADLPGRCCLPAAGPMLFSMLSRYSENDDYRVWRNMGQ